MFYVFSNTVSSHNFLENDALDFRTAFFRSYIYILFLLSKVRRFFSFHENSDFLDVSRKSGAIMWAHFVWMFNTNKEMVVAILQYRKID